MNDYLHLITYIMLLNGSTTKRTIHETMGNVLKELVVIPNDSEESQVPSLVPVEFT
jgi:hypothetical protein